MIEKFGTDIGGVIIEQVSDDSDTSFFKGHYLQTPMVHDSFESLRRLNQERFPGEVYVVSKCGPWTEARTREWFSHHGFQQATGIPEERLFFCRERKDKAPICDALGLSHFIDDSIDVLSFLTSVPTRYLLQPNSGDTPALPENAQYLIPVKNWQQVIDALL